MSWQQHTDAMEALVLPMGRRRKRLVLEMARELSGAMFAALERGEPLVGEAWQRYVAEDRDCAEAAAQLIAGVLSYYIEQGVSAIPRA